MSEIHRVAEILSAGFSGALADSLNQGGKNLVVVVGEFPNPIEKKTVLEVNPFSTGPHS